MAELVDASVSKTDEVTLVPVRSRPRVLEKANLIFHSLLGLLFLLRFEKKCIFANRTILKLQMTMNSIKKISLPLAFFFSLVFTASAAYLEKFPVTLTQPDSTVIHCFVTGDEFYNWVHDSNGYTLIRDPQTAYIVYAELQNDDLVSTGYVVGSIDPSLIAGLQPWTIISASKREQLRTNFLRHTPPPMNAQGGGGLVNAPGQNNGTINNIVIYIRFAGESEFPVKANTYKDWFNKDTVNYASMYRYFKDISHGKTLIPTKFYPTSNGDTIISYQDIYQRSYYEPYNAVSNPNGYTGGDNGNERTIREHGLLMRAVNALSSQIVASGLNLDYDNDGYVDNICFIVRGSPGAWAALLWPHQWALYSYNVTINGKHVYTYNFQVETHFDNQGASVLSHEMFHTLGAPDLYRYKNTSIDPVRMWDLMANNTTPPQSSLAYTKYKYGGWLDSIPEIKTPGIYTLNDVLSPTNNAYKIASPNSSTEYFVIEYRNKANYWESALPGSGLLIYRVNPFINGNADGPPDEVYVFRQGGNNNSTNGTYNNAYFSAQSGRTVFNNTSNPPCFLSNNQPGGIYIRNIDSSGGATMSFEVVATATISTTVRNGTITPSGAIMVALGADQQFTFSTNNCYEMDSLWIDGIYAPDSMAAGSYTFENVIGNHAIMVTFKQKPISVVPVSHTICSNKPYSFGKRNLTTSGIYYDTLKTIYGCDSIIKLTLTVNPAYLFTADTAICYGNTYLFRGKTLTVSGVYRDTLPTIHGCDSVFELNLTIFSKDTVIFKDTICYGKNYTLNGFNITNAITSNVYFNNDLNVNGCDSVTRLNLTVNSVDTVSIAASTCENVPYYFGDKYLTTAGIYYDTLQSVHGCDSIIELTLTVNAVYITQINESICDGDSYNFFGKLLTISDIYYDTLPTIHGCDSVFELNLTVYSKQDTVIFDDTICYGENYTLNGFNITNAITSNVYFNNDLNINGCDSVTKLNLTVNSVDTVSIAASTCENVPYYFGSKNLTTTGIYYDTLQTVHGCDSVIKLALTVNPLPETPTISKSENVLIASIANSYQWYFNNAPISGATEQSYICTQNGIYFVEVTNEYDCKKQSDSISITNVSVVETVRAPSLRVHPNPVNGQLIIENGELTIENVEIYNVVGQKLNNYQLSIVNYQLIIDVSPLASGMYFLKVGNKAVKFVKE